VLIAAVTSGVAVSYARAQPRKTDVQIRVQML
jgi:hypothetical protein